MPASNERLAALSMSAIVSWPRSLSSAASASPAGNPVTAGPVNNGVVASVMTRSNDASEGTGPIAGDVAISAPVAVSIATSRGRSDASATTMRVPSGLKSNGTPNGEFVKVPFWSERLATTLPSARSTECEVAHAAHVRRRDDREETAVAREAPACKARMGDDCPERKVDRSPGRDVRHVYAATETGACARPRDAIRVGRNQRNAVFFGQRAHLAPGRPRDERI